MIVLIATIIYFTKGSLWAKVNDAYGMEYGAVSEVSHSSETASRDILKKMDESGKNCVMFYGSQTGTAEDYAHRLAKEGSQRFGLKTMLADLEEFDYENLDQWPEGKLAFFVLATYGEGEPTDNAVDFYTFISSEDVAVRSSFSGDAALLHDLKYVAFGLGNSTYEHYNYMVRNTDKALQRLGAQRIGRCGEGDDGAGTMEEDFLAWKEPMWQAVMNEFGLEERDAVYEPVFEIEEQEEESWDAEHVYLGEPTKHHLGTVAFGPYNGSNPYVATVKASRELFKAKDRNCVHMELDISGSGLTYQAGDHLAVWPHNAGTEVDRFLGVFGLGAEERRKSVIKIKPIDVTAKVPFPSPTTYEAAVRYYMEICGPASRQFLSSLAPFAPTKAARQEIKRLADDKEYFQHKIASRCLNIAQTLESSDNVLKGVATNYLLALKKKQNTLAAAAADPAAPTAEGLEGVVDTIADARLGINDMQYVLEGPRNKLTPLKLPVHIRHSNFKLPSDPKRPIIMIGPGTGVAPFRGFVQERVELKKRGEEVGFMILFFGCRGEEEDFLYREEWEEHLRILGSEAFKLVTAISRAQTHKVYVQHRLREHARFVNDLLEQQRANFYVCGDASHMAREVNAVLVEIIAEQRGLALDAAEEVVKRMRTKGQYLEDVWS
ncbi:NADPH-cytochrome P450 reductase [Ascosphaera atra]|nr:NADPH-cytochrome P450 reductase [Ascosphaera atra]